MIPWQRTTLGSLIRIRHGFAFKGEHITEEDTGDLLLSPGNFSVGGGFQYKRMKFYSGPVPDGYVLQAGDVIVTMTDLSKEADTLGYSAVVPPSATRMLHNQRIGRVIANSASVYLPFIHWVMRTAEYRNEILANYTGSTVKHTSPAKIMAYSFDLPSLAEQRAISATLGALDDKIELNRTTAATLEEMSRALYRSWFVDFDPVRARAEGLAPAHMDGATAALFPDSVGEDGMPVGWGFGTLGEVALNSRNAVDPSKIGPETPYIGLEHMPRHSISINEWGNAEDVGSAKSMMKRGQLLFGKLRPYFHKVGIVPVSGICSTDILVVEAKRPMWREFVLSVISSAELVEHVSGASTGTRMPRAKWQDLANYKIPIASEAVVQAFSDMVAPMHARILALIEESRTLAALRNTLLPRLMSGELRAGAAREAVEDVV